MHAIVCIRVDIVQAVNVVSKYMSNLGKDHLECVEMSYEILEGNKV